MNKKGQAAMEFLMTYGWAILVVIAAIAALAYFGVLDPARLLPERCQSSAGMDCIDKASITSTGVTFALRNNQGYAIEITKVEGVNCNDSFGMREGTSGTPDLESVNVSNNNVVRINVGCTLTPGDRFDDTITITYTNTNTGIEHHVPVEIRGRVA